MRKLITYILGDSSSLERALKRSSAATKEFEAATVTPLGRVDNAFKKLGGVRTGAFVGGAAAVGAIATVKKLTGAASDLNEQITKNQAVFGDSAKSVQDWSETTAKSLGVSETAALTATGTFGNLFTAIGVVGPQAAQMSTSLVKLASDLASFNNASPEDVLDAIRSGLIGEAEPMRRYGVLLSEARVQQVALAQTGKDNVKELTNQEKALARYSIILKDTKTAQGDFARTSGGLANQQRILSAEVSDLQANTGKLLLPAMVKITGALVDATGAALDLVDGLKKLGKVKIPTIHIPFVTERIGGDDGGLEFGGGDLSGPLMKALGFTKDFVIDVNRVGNPIAGPMATLVSLLVDLGHKEAEGQTPRLAQEFSDSINSMLDSSLQSAANAIDPNIKVDLPPLNVTFGDLLINVGQPGFATGATPEDILGPLIKQLPNKFEESILDAEIAGKGIREAHVAARDRILEALDDPRLKAKDRIALKQALKAEQDAIKTIDDGIAQNRKDALSKAAQDSKKRATAAKAAATKLAQQQQKEVEIFLSALQAPIDRAEATKTFKDDLAASRAMQRGILDAIKIEGRTPDLVNKLFDQRQKTAELVDKRQTELQFRQIGLGPEGDEPIPGLKNLRKQFAALDKRITPGELTGKMASRFKQIGKFLSGNIKDLKDPVAAAIRDFFNDVRGEFDKGDIIKVNPRTTAINKNAIVAGLGLDRDTERLIRSRLSGINAAGRRLAPTPGTTGAFGITITPQPIHVNTTVNLDGQKVARNTTIHQQKNKRSNPAQKRGPLRGI